MNILIIGMGSLGFRHLHSLKTTLPLTNFFILEKKSSEIIITELENRGWASSKFFKGINWYNSINELPIITYNYILISTTADIRGYILLEITKKFKFESIIIEKPITNNCKDLKSFESIKHNKIFVNYPRRYQKIHQILLDFNLEPKTIRFHSYNMGLLCNFSHYVDFARMIIGDKEKITNVHTRFTNIFESKRNEYFEVNGMLTINFSDKCILEIIDNKNNLLGNNWGFEISTDHGKYWLDETKQYLVGPNNLKKQFASKLQSELTGQYIQDIQKGICKLPKLKIPLQDLSIILPEVENSVGALLKRSGFKHNYKLGYFT